MNTTSGLSRRQFLQGAGAVSALAFGGAWVSRSWFLQQEDWLISACSDRQGRHYVAAFTPDGQIKSQIPVPARAHECLSLAGQAGRALIVARRPGDYLLEVDFASGRIVKQIEAGAGRHFYGHACLLPTQGLVCTSQNDYGSGQGRLVFYDLASLKEVQSFDSGGIGPHQVKLMPDNRTLVVANGGILTHPDRPREKLNLDTMEPNLSYLDLNSGDNIGRFQLDNKRLSIRHLDVGAEGKVVAGLQYQGAKTHVNPLLLSHDGQGPLQLFQASDATWLSMRQYIASVCVDGSNDRVIASCPKANKITFWQLSTGRFLAEQRLRDGAGIVMSSQGVLASGGKGDLMAMSPDSHHSLFRHQSLRWDNHLTRLRWG